MSDKQRQQIAELEEKNARLASALRRARQQLQQRRDQENQIIAEGGAATVAIFLGADQARRRARVAVGSQLREVPVAAQVDLAGIAVGQEVLISDENILVEVGQYSRSGEVVTVAELLGADRVITRSGSPGERIYTLAGRLRGGSISAGDSLLVDHRCQLALEKVVRSSVDQMLTVETPSTTYADIGGLGEQIELVRDTLELPFKHPQLHGRYALAVPRGILLYGPPGCGKTLIAKAVANSLAQARSGQRAHFLSVKGPELLNKYVGETERHIRTIFSRARKLARAEVPVVIFFDEMEALFRTRGTGISSDMETLIVPQLLAEMDGVESLDNVIIIGASNREDMIDPAVLRPGRFDLKVRIERPDRVGAREIFTKYLTADLPMHAQLVAQRGSAQAAAQYLIDLAVEVLYTRSAQTALLHARTASGRVRTMYAADLISGAMIAAIVERAKQYALKADLAGEPGLTVAHLRRAIATELHQSAHLALSTNLTEWARVSGFGADELVAVEPIARDQVEELATVNDPGSQR